MIDLNHTISIKTINSVYPLQESTIDFLDKTFKTKTYRKGEIMLLEGEIRDEIYVIRKGLIRGYRTFEKDEITFWVSVDQEFFAASSYFFKTPSDENIECLEDCVLDYLTFDEVKYAINQFDDFRNFYIKNLEIYYRYAQLRSILSRIPLGTKRVKYFFENYSPEIVKRTPDKYISSFLNMKPETYSRIKKELLKS